MTDYQVSRYHILIVYTETKYQILLHKQQVVL